MDSSAVADYQQTVDERQQLVDGRFGDGGAVVHGVQGSDGVLVAISDEPIEEEEQNEDDEGKFKEEKG